MQTSIVPAVAALTALALILLPLSPAPASAASATLTIGSLSTRVGEEGTVEVRALGLAPPGLGAWTVHASWNASVVEVTECGARQGGVCSTTFGPETGILTGASEHGLTGDATLGSFTFRCEHAGTSPLVLETFVFADATADSPQDLDVTIQHGSFVCSEASPTEPPSQPTVTPTFSLPETGNGGGPGDAEWPIALAAFGALAFACAARLAGRSRS